MKTTIYNIRRHEKKDGDKLTPEGLVDALLIGKGSSDIAAFRHSEAYRAQQTANLIAAGYANALIEQFGDEHSRARAGEVLNCVEPDSRLNNYSGPMPAVVESNAQVYDWLFANQYYGEDGPSGALFDESVRVLDFVADPLTGYDGVVEAISHGPKVEASLMTLVDSAMGLSDIGGIYGEGEAYSITVTRTEEGIFEARVEARGVDYGDRKDQLYEIIGRS